MDNFQSGLLSFIYDAVVSKATKFVYKFGFRQPQLCAEEASGRADSMSLDRKKATPSSCSKLDSLLDKRGAAGDSIDNHDQQGSDGKTFVPVTRNRMVEFYSTLKESLSSLRIGSKMSTERVEETNDVSLDDSGVSSPNEGAVNNVQSYEGEEEMADFEDSQTDKYFVASSSTDHAEFPSDLLPEAIVKIEEEDREASGNGYEINEYGEVDIAHELSTMSLEDDEVESPVLPPEVKPKKIRKKRVPEEEGPSELSLALARLMDPNSNIDVELENLQKLNEKVRSETLWSRADSAWTSEEDESEEGPRYAASPPDSDDDTDVADDEAEEDGLTEETVDMVVDAVNSEDVAADVDEEVKELSEEQKLKKEERARKKAEREAALTQLLEGMSMTDSESDSDDERVVSRFERGSSNESDVGMIGPLLTAGVSRDLYDDNDESSAKETDDEGFDEFFKLFAAEKAAEKERKDKKAQKPLEAAGPENPETQEQDDDENAEDTSEPPDEYPTSESEDIARDIIQDLDEDSDDEDPQENQRFGTKLLNVLHANCAMTDDELEAQRRKVLGIEDPPPEEKPERIPVDHVFDESEGSEKDNVRKVLVDVDQNKARAPRRKNVNPFEVDPPEPNSSLTSSSKAVAKKDAQASQQKRKTLPSTSGSDMAVSGEATSKRLKSEERAAEMSEVDRLEGESMDTESMDTEDGEVEVMDVDSPSEASSSTRLIFEDRRLRFEGKEKSSSKSPKPKPSKRTKQKILTDEELSAETIHAKEEEEARMERVIDLDEELLENKYPDNVLDVSALKTSEGEEGHPVTVQVHPDLWKCLQPHQIEGVRFIYRNVIESVAQDAKYQGCILAHSMGLGKTLQVITFLQAVLSCPEMALKTCLVLCPVAVVLNWDSEVKEWMSKIPKDAAFKSYVLTSENGIKAPEQMEVARQWQKTGGVLVMGYTLYLSYCQRAEAGKMSSDLLTYLREPGPDILVCDEAHVLKNENGKQLQCVSQIATHARIALTGTPLQNNLKEYYTMVNFVKPALLGSSKEFEAQFLHPIMNGSKKEADEEDVTLMKERSSILRSSLSGCLQIRGAAILKNSIPNKTEYLINLRLTELQARLYKTFIAYCKNSEDSNAKRSFWHVMMTAQLITFHPKCLQKEAEKERRKFVLVERKQKEKDAAKKKKAEGDKEVENNPTDTALMKTVVDTDVSSIPMWFDGVLPTSQKFVTDLGAKAIVIREIILEAQAVNDKVLIFSDRIAVLECLEELLVSIDEEKLRTTDGRRIMFKPHVNYLSFDGATNVDKRFDLIKQFNQDPSATVFLLSIKAAGTGINLVSANRVILVEPSFNPTTDKQAIFRVYRYGQKKTVYVYRLVSYGTTESHVCDFQLQKDTMSGRVLEEKHADRLEKSQENVLEFKQSPYDARFPFKPVHAPEDPVMWHLLRTVPELIVSVKDYDKILEATEPELPVEEAVRGYLRLYWSLMTTAPGDRGDPFEGLPVDWNKVAEEFSKDRSRNSAFTCEAKDLVSLDTFIAKYYFHRRRTLKRDALILDIVRKLIWDIRNLRQIVNPMRQKIQEEMARKQQTTAQNPSSNPRPASAPTTVPVEVPLDGTVLAHLKLHWVSKDTPVDDRGNPFAKLSGVDVNKLAELFNANKTRAGKFPCAAADLASLDTFIAKYVLHARRSLGRDDRAREIVKMLIQDLRVVRNILAKMQQK